MRTTYRLFISLVMFFIIVIAAGCTSKEAAVKTQRAAVNAIIAQARADSVERAYQRREAADRTREAFSRAEIDQDWTDVRPTADDPTGAGGLRVIEDDLVPMRVALQKMKDYADSLTWIDAGISETQARQLYTETSQRYVRELLRIYRLPLTQRVSARYPSAVYRDYFLDRPSEMAELVHYMMEEYDVPLAAVGLTKTSLDDLARRDFRAYVDYWRLKLRTANNFGVALDTKELSDEINSALGDFKVTRADLGLTEIEVIVVTGR